MRSDKYNQEEINDSLSLTREMKFRDLQEKIDQENKEPTREIRFHNIEKKKEELKRLEEEKLLKTDDLFLDLDIPKKEDEIRIEQIKVASNNQKNSKKPKLIWRLLVNLICFAFIFIISYMFFYPFVLNNFFTTPKMVFDSTIDYVADYFLENIKYDNSNIVYQDINFKIDSNIEDLSSITNYNYGISFGYDLDKKVSEQMIYVKDNQEKYGSIIYEKDNKKYLGYTNTNKILEIADSENDNNYEEIAESQKKFETLFNGTLTYIVDKERDILKDLIKEDNLTRVSDTIEVNGEFVKVNKNTLSLDKKEYKEFKNNHKEKVLSDEKYVECLMDILDLTKEELEEYLKIQEKEETLVINIYTNSINKIVGIDIEEDGFRTLYYYSDNNGNFNAYIDLSDNICLPNNDCNVSEQDIYEFSGTNNKVSANINIKLNHKDIGSIDLKKISSSKIEFDYNINIEENTLSGEVLFLKEKNSINLDFTLKNEEEYFNINLNVEQKNDVNIADFTDKEIVAFTNYELQEDFINYLKDNNLLDAYNNIASMFMGFELEEQEQEVEQEIDTQTQSM